MNITDLKPSAAVRSLNPALFPAGPASARLAELAEAGRAVMSDGAAERDLQRACEHELHRRGVWFLHLSPKAREKIGCPDLLFAHPVTGQFCGVELKSETGRLSDAQKRVLADIERNGGRVAVVRSYEEFLKTLEV